jgi:hypothetical protein
MDTSLKTLVLTITLAGFMTVYTVRIFNGLSDWQFQLAAGLLLILTGVGLILVR